MGVQLATLWVLRNWFSPTVAFSFSFVFSTTTHYLLNRHWALPSDRRDHGRQLGEYVLAVLLSYAINLAAFKLCHALLGMSVIWAAFWAVPPSTVVVFLLLNYRVFRLRAE